MVTRVTVISRIHKDLLQQTVVWLEISLKLASASSGMVERSRHFTRGEVNIDPDRTLILVRAPTARFGVMFEGHHVALLSGSQGYLPVLSPPGYFSHSLWK